MGQFSCMRSGTNAKKGTVHIAQTKQEGWAQKIKQELGETLEEWEQWTQAAETGLRRALGVEPTGTEYRGGPVRYRNHIMRPQDGKYGVGTNRAFRKLSEHAARQDRYQQLAAHGTDATEATEREMHHLYEKLHGDTEPNAAKSCAGEPAAGSASATAKGLAPVAANPARAIKWQNSSVGPTQGRG